MAFRFVHTADVHLDSPLRSLALRDPEIAELVGNATRRTFERIVDLCLEERVDALMIAGDLYDGDLRSMKTAIFFGVQMRRLTDEGIRVFIVRGNHDAESVITKQLSLPDGVHVFPGRAEAVPIDGRDVVVHGISFARPHAPESLLPRYKAPVPGCVNIGLLHTSLGGAEGHDVYSPCSLAELVAHGFDYWGLGHIHKRQVHVEDACTVVMPGNPQGRDVGEAGAKSVTLVSVSDSGSVALEERFVGVAQFERIAVDLGGQDEWSGVAAVIDAALSAARSSAVSDHLIARLELGGTTPIASRLRRDADLLLDEARQAAARLPRTAIEKVALDVRAPTLREAPADYDPVVELGRLMTDEVLASEGFRAIARGIVSDLQRQLPPELRDGLGASDAQLDETASRIAADGGEEVLARLEGTEAGG